MSGAERIATGLTKAQQVVARGVRTLTYGDMMAQEIAQAALAALKAEGMVIVPVEPIRQIEGAMVALSAYQQADMNGVMGLTSRQAIEEILAFYRAMIAASEGEG